MNIIAKRIKKIEAYDTMVRIMTNYINNIILLIKNCPQLHSAMFLIKKIKRINNTKLFESIIDFLLIKWFKKMEKEKVPIIQCH